MQPTAAVQKHLSDLARIYAKAKKIILLAEELDPTLRSNIMVFKELRDSNDHLMRLLNEWFVSGGENERYMIAQIDKARGHVFRAGYDAIDGIIVSYKIRVATALEKISNDAISNVYPDYYIHATEIDLLNGKIANHRNNKDVADDSLEDLENYSKEAEQCANFCKTALSRVPMMIEWDKKHRKRTIIENIVLALIIGSILAVIGGVACGYSEHLFNSESSASIPAKK
jgi:hypothetical protein